MSTLVWDGTRLSPGEPAGELRVADSWRQVDGRVRRFDLHRERFVRSVAETAGGLDAGSFMAAARAAVPGRGEWFPRVRLAGDVLAVDVRPGPPRHPEVIVQVLPPGDPRSAPRVKGPDLALAGGLLAEARDRGAGEVLLTDDAGRVLEAGYAAVVWWVGDDLCVPDGSLTVLPSVTRRIVVEHARDLGVRVREVEAAPGHLEGRETWLLNAYQGLRVVTGWVGAGLTAGAAERAPEWRAWLESV